MKFIGIAAFAILSAAFPTDRFLQQFPHDVKNPAVAVLVNYFGRNNENLKKFTDKFEDRPHLVQLHLGYNDFTTRQLLKMGPRVQARINRKIEITHELIRDVKNENTHIVITPILEDRVRFDAWRKYARIVRQEFGVPLVRSTVGGSRGGGRYEELHVVNPRFSRRRCIANLDGVSINWGRRERYDLQITPQRAVRYRNEYRHCFAVFSWSADQQGLGGTKNFQKPPISRRRYRVTDAAIRGHKRTWFSRRHRNRR